MLGLDTEKHLSWRSEAAKEKAAELRRKELVHEIMSNTVTVEDDAGRDVSELLAQLGKPMPSQDVIAKLKLCNPRLIFIKHPTYELYGIYVKKLERNLTGSLEERQIHVCGMESGIMPEFSVLHKTTKNVPDPELLGNKTPTREVNWKQVPTFLAETRGWRTVLVRLLKAGLISEGQVRQYFGWEPSRQSRKWHERVSQRIAL